MAGDCLKAPLLDSEHLRDASNEAEVIVNINGYDRSTIQSFSKSNNHAGHEEQAKVIEDQNPFDFIGAGSFSVPPLTTIDPFRNNTPNIEALYEWLKILVCIPIAIVRLILFGLCVAVGYIATKCALQGWKDKQSPMPKWRCRIMWITRICSRSILFSFGYHWIKRIGRPAPRETAPIVVSNHVSYIDPIFFFYELFPTIVSSESHDAMPFVGTIIRAMQVIYVNRFSASSRSHAVSEIKRKASCNDFPRVLLFPEGTTTNGRVLITFQLGAFIPGYPIQPIVVRYPHVHFDQSWGNISLAKSMFRMFTQFHNFMEIEYLPIVSPLQNQKESAAHFAERTSYTMASALNVVQTSHSYLDSLLVTEALKSKQEKASTYMVEISKSFNISTSEAMDFLDKFLSMNPDPSGRVKIHDFLRVLRLRASPLSQKIFGYLDVEKQGSVTFRQFFFGSVHILKRPFFWQACESAFTKFDGQGSIYVSQQQLQDSLKMALPGLSEEVGELFNIFDTDSDGRVSKEDFMTCLRRNPLLIALFCHGSASEGLLQREGNLEVV
ncbi:lysophospholipid acyltransferase LPEAT2-like isoform X2 [Telopea speciosissima]|uniref:lysophospholipid acyltransferase LPEAT2-like isoform X2 n=1 Tax=Telopea speciosissima TaxID=54955 RepID=UPI001CC66D2C|nr:lysophospholipid acyltransferase LPEAT2-like isoform X2 [Telopea speciosissima]